MRMALHEMGVKIGVRTKRLEELLEKAFLEASASPESAAECAKRTAAALSDNTLFFFPPPKPTLLLNTPQKKASMPESLWGKMTRAFPPA